MSMLRLLLPVAVLAVIAIVIMRRRRPADSYRPDRYPQDEVRETIVAAEGAAAS
ncbi:MAG: hypothetical protein HZB15_01165 [Actinobacteria bacterium]|nr:hypothetical protein [Actinomycetota bacterium]